MRPRRGFTSHIERLPSPLPVLMLEVLIAVASGAKDSLAVAEHVKTRSAYATAFNQSALYTSLNRLLATGALVEGPATVTGSTRRRTYELSSYGRAVAREEIELLHTTLRAASHAGLAAMR